VEDDEPQAENVDNVVELVSVGNALYGGEDTEAEE
jgi:hypothetical protein